MSTTQILVTRGGGGGLDRTVGTIATIQGPFAYGPRPGDPTNVLHAPAYDVIEDSAERARYRSAFTARGYVRWPVGPIYGTAYDHDFPDTNWLAQPQIFLDRIDELIGAGCVPNLHVIPDDPPARLGSGGSAADPNFPWLDQVLAPIYRSPGFQTRFREVTVAWEPEWDSAMSVRAAQWVRGVFPDAWIWFHMQPGHSAPGQSHENEAACMQAIAPIINGLRFQSGQWGGYDYEPYREADGTWVFSRRTRLQQFLREIWDICRRLKYGIAGWPTVGYGGRPLVCDASEWGSYWVYHGQATEAEVRAWATALRTTPPYEDPDNPGEIIDLRPYQPILLGDGGPI